MFQSCLELMEVEKGGWEQGSELGKAMGGRIAMAKLQALCSFVMRLVFVNLEYNVRKNTKNEEFCSGISIPKTLNSQPSIPFHTSTSAYD